MLETSYVIGYIVLVLIIGYVSGRKQTGDNFMIANRKLGLSEFVATVVASSIGGGFLVAYTAYIYEFGIGTLSAIFGYAIGFVLFGLVAKRIRKTAHQNNFHTLADYFNFHSTKKVSHFIAVMIGITFTFWLITQFIAGTQILSAISGYSYELSLLISASVVLVYLILGGFQSVVRTDVFQYLVLLFLIFLIGFIMVHTAYVPLIEFTKDETSPSLIIYFPTHRLAFG
ncbi:hypothetical protein COY07_02130 [Candidatus Peregrinibacteria bacterium CG_4_10_14_0_2_um_filter_43_11]|nr:MAG: hypothetical protein COY07_02130 [Candidatus Peregrinibacteria bacterium CG_4_10_14_0_2_um_filter_43_11]